MSALYIIHLSDLHIDAASQPETAPMTGALCRRLAEFRKERGLDRFDLLIISGDLSR
jgi:3',5'-cyclic AMP phosphodiesterase CpdA